MAETGKYTEMEVYCKATECGIGDKLYCSSLIGDLQEAAERSSNTIGYGTSFLKEIDICWIILKMRLHIDELPSWHETFRIRTWANSIEKFYYGRDFEIFNAEGRLIGQATSTWILADWNSHRPVIANKRPDLPPPVIQDPRFAFGESCPKLAFPARIDIAGETEKPVIIKYADYNELDRNRHVNNSRYTAWAYDALFKNGYDVSKIEDLVINYNSEVKAGEKVELFISSDGPKVSVFGYKNIDTKVFAVELTMRQ
ncbi:acyl-[acyl-carrier-protein] thioesterase [Butyrivibrio sp. AE2032]|uniref:acyl-[acyl-carrier-protein] thioesterase n=1 Tax=Butyrivibrio sp. AE2032 TaxID=1458463 RepID=UPI0005548199|nr:acyl-ACP thioesterase domain-containing protein [Butyrivibrio sp. AE2032]